MSEKTSRIRSMPQRRSPMVLAIFATLLISLSVPNLPTAEAHHFGFRGGFRGGFKSSTFRRGFSRRGFGRVGRFNSFRFRGFRGFGRSRFNSLAFRGRRFGASGFNRFGRFNRFNRFGPRRFVSNFGGFNRFRGSRFNSFAFSHFPVNRVYTGFRPYQPTYIKTTPVNYSIPSSCGTFYTTGTYSNAGWKNLASGQYNQATTVFTNNMGKGIQPAASRIGYALSNAASGNLDQGVWAMKRALERNSSEIANMAFDDEIRDTVEEVTMKYEQRMEAGTHKDDDAFMLAALYQMQGDPEMAAMAADYVSSGKTETAMVNLDRLIQSEMASLPMTHSTAWDLLAEGQTAQAIEEFRKEIGNDQQAGSPKLGFALANAQMGDFERAAWAIRRAFEVDAQAVSDIMLDGKLRPMLMKIGEQFEDSEMELDADHTLVMGTIYQLLGDTQGAEFVIKQGEIEPNEYLVSLINNEMKAQEEMLADCMPAKGPAPDQAGLELLDFVPSSGTDGSATKETPLSPTPENNAQQNDDAPLFGPELPPSSSNEIDQTDDSQMLDYRSDPIPPPPPTVTEGAGDLS